MGKFEELKQAIANPPPERLAKIEYRSHFYQIIGVSAVCTVLIAKGYWYVIFAFIFSIGVSYSNGIASYQKYKLIKSMTAPEPIEKYLDDKSPTRRRSKIITHVFGKKAFYLCSIFSVAVAVLFIPPTLSRPILILSYLMAIFTSYAILYFFIGYWIAYPLYRREIERGDE